MKLVQFMCDFSGNNLGRYSLSLIAHVQICLVKGGQAKAQLAPPCICYTYDVVYKQEYIHIQFHIHTLNFNNYSITYIILYDAICYTKQQT